MEKLNIDDAFVMEIVVDKINEMIDKLMEMDERLSRRVDNHWAYHRRKYDEEKGKLDETPK